MTWQTEIRATVAAQTPEQTAVAVQWLIAFGAVAAPNVQGAYADVIGEVARIEQEATQ